MRAEAPATYEEASELLRACSESGSAVRFRGGGTKLGWGTPVAADVTVSTSRLDSILEHNEGDLTAVVQAGVPLAEAQAAFSRAAQRLAIDPPDGDATIGGIIASGDSGPLRHRYGTMRDLVVGMTVVLSDGAVARSGGKVIKNVAGYDIGKLFAGAFGTLGMIVEVAVRLHPLPRRRVTVRSAGDDPAALVRAASALAHLPLEMDSLDVAWGDGRGEVLTRFTGSAPEGRAQAAAAALGAAGLPGVIEDDDDALWDAQRAAQRTRGGALARISAPPAALPAVIGAAPGVVGRAGAGVFYARVEGDDLVGALEDLRRAAGPADVVVLDAPEDVRAKVDVWGAAPAGSWDLMRRIKARFDPAGICNPGIFVGGI